MELIKLLGYIFFSILSIIILLFISILLKVFKIKRKKIIFGTTPILTNKYWSDALNNIGIESETLMRRYYSSINKKNDYNKYFDEIIPEIFKKKYLDEIAYLFFVWLYIIYNAKIFIMPFHGIVFKKYFWKIELILFKLNGIKVIVLPYGSDAYMYSKINDKSLQHVLLESYPDAARNEKIIENKVFFWSKYTDCTFNAYMGIDGMPRWDIPLFSFIQIDTNLWNKKKLYSTYNGLDGKVKILHSPNHRSFKGTEYLLQAITDLKNEGLQLELVLLEKVQNSKVRDLMQDVDLLAEQFIATGYALSGIEGMASGLPVLANLDNKEYTELFRRYSFLNECPILSTTPETLKDNLRLLVTNPKLRKELGELGRKYAEKYHSYKMAQHMFTHIFRKLDGEDIDLMNLYHPLKSEYVKNNYIQTPLVNNRYIHKEEV
ncbi:MAG: aminotransferase [Arcobacter sp.]|nr:MAG: aminotransferase [Arcobacter sp.]